MSTWGTRPVSTTQTRISSKLWGEKFIDGISEEFAHTLSLSWKICSYAFTSFEKKRQSSDRSYFKCSHPCSGQQRSQVALLKSVLIPHVHHDFSRTFLIQNSKYGSFPVWQQLSVVLDRCICCALLNAEAIISKAPVQSLSRKRRLLFYCLQTCQIHQLLFLQSPLWVSFIYLEAWLFGLDNQTQVWCSIFQVKTT